MSAAVTPTYVVLALVVTIAVTVTLRAAPFGLRSLLRDSPWLADLGRWMPLGAITILACYCLSAIDLAGPDRGLPELAGVATVLAVHGWRRNAVLSIVGGTAACLLVTRLVGG